MFGWSVQIQGKSDRLIDLLDLFHRGFLRGILHGIKLALTNPDMAKKTLSRNMRLTDPEAVEEVY